MGRSHLRIGLTVALLGLAALVVRAGEAPAGPRLVATATGSVKLDSSRDGKAILVADDMKPGDTVSGTLTLSNPASVAQRLTLATVGVRNTPGPRGGRLSDRLLITVE